MAKLTRLARVSAAQQKISTLTADHEYLFKVIFSHQVESRYDFCSVHSRNGTQVTMEEKAKLFAAFGKFMDDTTKLPITEVENRYKRLTDQHDGTFDPNDETAVEIIHFCLFEQTATPTAPSDSVRIHGYYSTGYFVVTRLDWFHEFHS